MCADCSIALTRRSSRPSAYAWILTTISRKLQSSERNSVCATLRRMPLIIILIILLLIFGGGGYYMGPGVGYYGGGGVSLILLIVILFLLFGRGRRGV